MVVEQPASLFDGVVAVAFCVEVVQQSDDWNLCLVQLLVLEQVS
jgi:hypothetical protein